MSSPDRSTFSEEPLFLSGGQGFGFFPARPGLLLNDGRYEVLRKLGRGQFSSTWLASDPRYVHSSIRRYIITLVIRLIAFQSGGKAEIPRHKNTDGSCD
jgi:hypothetical protein